MEWVVDPFTKRQMIETPPDRIYLPKWFSGIVMLLKIVRYNLYLHPYRDDPCVCVDCVYIDERGTTHFIFNLDPNRDIVSLFTYS